MRFSGAGCVENTSPINPRAPGSAMHAIANERIAPSFLLSLFPLIFRRAFASPIGLRVICAPVASAAWMMRRWLSVSNGSH